MSISPARHGADYDRPGRSFEGAIAAMGAPLVGLLAEKAYGFEGTAEVGAAAPVWWHEKTGDPRQGGHASLPLTWCPIQPNSGRWAQMQRQTWRRPARWATRCWVSRNG